MELEAAGVPTAVLVTERFEAVAARAATGFGLPDARRVVVAHPIGGEPDEVLEELARGAVDRALGLLTRSASSR